MNLCRVLSGVHITTGQFIKVMLRTNSIYVVRETPENYDEALDGDSLLDLYADIEEYNRHRPPTLINQKLVTSIQTYNDDPQRLPTRHVKLELSVVGADPVLTLLQLIDLTKLFEEYIGDRGLLYAFVALLSNSEELRRHLDEIGGSVAV